jgi:hypothetical protein
MVDLSADANETMVDLSAASTDSTDARGLGDVASKASQDAEYRRALNDMLLLRLFNESSAGRRPDPPSDMRPIYAAITPPPPGDNDDDVNR